MKFLSADTDNELFLFASSKPVTEGNIASGDGGESDMTVTVVDDQDLLKILASALISRREDIEEELDDDDDDELWQM